MVLILELQFIYKEEPTHQDLYGHGILIQRMPMDSNYVVLTKWTMFYLQLHKFQHTTRLLKHITLHQTKI